MKVLQKWVKYTHTKRSETPGKPYVEGTFFFGLLLRWAAYHRPWDQCNTEGGRKCFPRKARLAKVGEW